MWQNLFHCQLPVLMQITVDFLIQRELKEAKQRYQKYNQEKVFCLRERERESTKSLQVQTGMVGPCMK